jgi:transposase-like protein
MTERLGEMGRTALSHLTLLETHRSQIRSTNGQEWPTEEIERRPAVVGIFRNRGSLSAWSG